MVISTVNQVVYNGDGVTTAWPYTFRIIDATDIKLTIIDEDGTETDVSADYYVDTVNNTVYYPGYAPGAEPPEADQPAPVQAGQKILIYRELPITQEKNLGEKWPFNVIELGLDKLTMILQQISGWWDRCLKISPTDETLHPGFDLTFPIVPGKSFRINSTGTGFEPADDPATYAGVAEQAAETAEAALIAAEAAKEAAESAAAVTELQAVWFDNTEDLKAADLPTNITAGKKGYTDINDGGAGLYNIRTADLSDVDDGDNIIVLDNGNVAEKLHGSLCRFLFPKTYIAQNWTHNGDRGDCQIVITPSGKVLMIDASSEHQYTYLMSYMAEHGITKVDFFLLTHYHSDHYGNIQNFLAQNTVDFSNTKWFLPYVDNVPSSETNYYLTVQGWLAGEDVTYLDSDRTVQLDNDVTMYLFNCSDAARTYHMSHNIGTEAWNDFSVQALIYHKDVVAYYTGDLWAHAIEYVSATYNLPNVDLFKVNHHGWIAELQSGLISVQDYVKKLSPKNSVYNMILTADWNGIYPNASKTSLVFWTQNYGDTLNLADDAEYVSDGKNLVKVSNNELRASAIGEAKSIVYIDCNYDYSNGVPTGAEDRPFTCVNEARYFIGNLGTQLKLHFAAGEYSMDLADCTVQVTCESGTTFKTIQLYNVNFDFESVISVEQMDITNSNGYFLELDFTPVTTQSVITRSRIRIKTLVYNADSFTGPNAAMELITSVMSINSGTFSDFQSTGNAQISCYGASYIGIESAAFVNIAKYVFSGGSGGGDVTVFSETLSNVTAGVFGNLIVNGKKGRSAATTSRPSSYLCNEGLQIYDTTLKKPIWWNGSAWKDASGANV